VADISCDIVVIGAGVLGLSVAAELTARGRDVRVVDPGLPNASSVAAGMIAPAAETILDDLGGPVPALLRASANLWPALASRLGIRLDSAAAEWMTGDREGVEADLILMGFEPQWDGQSLRLPSDVRIWPDEALSALARSLDQPVIQRRVLGLAAELGGWRLDLGDASLRADFVVLATGADKPISGLPPSVAKILHQIVPIAGQIGLAQGRLTDRVLRGASGYVLPGPGDTTVIGATMVRGEAALEPDAVASEVLLRMAECLLGRKVTAPVEWRVGVRGASPDGLPMAGPTAEPLIHVALAPRRNGWLLGPLVGRVVADGIEGRPRDAHAAALDPLRFSPQSF